MEEIDTKQIWNETLESVKVSVSNKISNKAVHRNNSKRKIRSTIKQLISQFPACDYLVIVRKDLYKVELESILEQFIHVLSQIK